MGLGPRAKIYPAIAVSLLSLWAATPARAETLTVTGITIGDAFAVTVPTIEAVDTNLTEAQIRGLFTGNFLSEAGALAALDAARVTIPEISVSYDVPKASGVGVERATVVYHDLELTSVVDGVAASATVASTTIKGGAGLQMNFGQMSLANFDIGGMLSFYGMAPADEPDVFKTIYADFTFEGGTLTGPKVACDIAGARLAEFQARPLSVNFGELVELIQSVHPKAKPTPEQIDKIIDFYVGVFTAFRSTPMTMDGFSCTATSDKGNPVTVSSGGMEMGGLEPGTYPAISINDTRIEVENEGLVSLGNFTFKKMDFNDAIAALVAAKAELSEKWFETNWRKIIPAFDGLSFGNLDFDVPDPEHAGQRIQGSVGDFDISLADWFTGVPTTIGASAHHIAFTVPDEGEGKAIRAAGIDKLDLGYDLALHWDRGAQSIVVDKLAVLGDDLGSISLSAVLGNASEKLFDSNVNIAMVAAQGLTLKELNIDLDDQGFSTLLIGMIAAEERQDPNVMRAGFSGLVRAMTMGLLGPSKESLALGAQIGAFIDGKPQLKVHLVANDPAGISLADLMAAEKDPTVLAKKVTITAEANGEQRDMLVPVPVYEPEPEPESADETPAPADDSMAAPVDDGVLSPTQQDKVNSKN